MLEQLHLEKHMQNTFEECYSPRDNWMQYSPDPISFLRSYYGEYFDSDNRVNYALLKESLSPRPNESRPSTPKSARELFRNLFSMPFSTTMCEIRTAALNSIERNFGKYMVAHGIEESKSGMCGILMMAIGNRVLSPHVSFGSFNDGPPNISPLSHGPYYLIWSMPGKINESTPNYPHLTDMAAIVVPFDQNKQMLVEKFEVMIDLGLVDASMRDHVINKLMTYEQLYEQLLLQARPKRVLEAIHGSGMTMFDNEENEYRSKAARRLTEQLPETTNELDNDSGADPEILTVQSDDPNNCHQSMYSKK